MQKLDMSHSVGTRAFKKDFGLSPKNYLNKLRSFQGALYLLLRGHPVSVTGSEVGFQEISRFQKEFKKYFGGAPSAYRFDAGNASDKTSTKTN